MSVLKIYYCPLALILMMGGIWGCPTTDPVEALTQADISIGNGIALHPNGKILLTSRPITMDEATGKSPYRIFIWKFQDGSWCCETEAPFSKDYTDYHPVFHPDGDWVYFNSTRPKPGEMEAAEKVDIWRVKYHSKNWGQPEYLASINTEYHESYPTISRNGHLYFNSDRPGGKGSMDIYVSKIDGEKLTRPESVIALNSEDSENDLVVDPAERFIIFNRYDFETKEIDLYVAEKVSNHWSDPVPLHQWNEAGIWELTPSLSPNGQYFIYEVNGKIRIKMLKEINL